MNDNIACAAHRYAERGWPVLPLEPQNKKPLGRLVRRGLHDATVDHKLIDRWWHEEPYANVGLRTGVRFDALDCDGEEALAAFPHDLAPGEPPILGPTVVTGRELGLHCYVPPSGLGSRKPAPGLDYKGRNGYVVAPPSVHPSGAVYRWYDGEDDPYRGVDAPIQPAPAWLLALLYPPADTRVVDRAKPSRGGFGSGRRKRYGRRALEHEITRVATTQEGERNIALNRAAFRLGQLVPNGAIDVDSAIEALVLVAEMIGLPAVEAEGTIASGFRAGAHNPSWS